MAHDSGMTGAGTRGPADATLEVIDPNDDGDGQLHALERTCRTLGFFRIPFDAVPVEVREPAWDDARRFFALPVDRKMEVGFPGAGYPYGYSPFRHETLAASTGEASPPDLKESLSVGPDCLGHVIDLTIPEDAWPRSPSLWPEEPTTLRETWTACFRSMSKVAARLLSMMAEALDLPADHFGPLIDRETSAMRALRYPPIEDPTVSTGAGPNESSDGALRAGAHSDYGTLTILRTDGVPGLEVRGADGDWVAVSDEPDTFVVNLGDSVAQWTNDRWPSTLHRVNTVSADERHSMAFFHMANWDARIECLPTCLDPGQDPRHAPVLAGPWLMSKFQRTQNRSGRSEDG